MPPSILDGQWSRPGMEQITISTGWAPERVENCILEFHSAWQVVQKMAGTESIQGESHFTPRVIEWHIDELANANTIVVTHPVSLVPGWRWIQLDQRHRWRTLLHCLPTHRPHLSPKNTLLWSLGESGQSGQQTPMNSPLWPLWIHSDHCEKNKSSALLWSIPCRSKIEHWAILSF